MFNGFHGGAGSFPYVSRLASGQNPAAHPFIGATNAAFPVMGHWPSVVAMVMTNGLPPERVL
jgi:hypothetical protein